MKIVIPGGSGHVGTVLARAFHGDGHEVVVLSRTPEPAPWRVRLWNGRTAVGSWAKEIDGADVVINLAGRSVNCRYHAKNRREILLSRIESVAAVGQAIARASNPPRVWLQASTATIYAHRFDAPNDEATGIIGGDEPDAPDTWNFSINIARAWERALDKAPVPVETRRVKLRMGMVMSPDRGGAFDALLNLVRLGLGGPVAGGRQYVSWQHEADLIRAVRFLIDHDEIDGLVNLTAPNPLPYAEFMRTLRQAWGMPFGLPAAGWMVEAGTRLMHTESELVLKSRRVVPARLTAAGFTYAYPEWAPAAAELCRRRRLREGTGVDELVPST